eukprot:XP_762830.1 hypothetical protein [Theileria parva strain Muguga]
MDLVCVDIEIQNPLNDLLYNLLKDDKGKELVYMLSKEGIVSRYNRVGTLQFYLKDEPFVCTKLRGGLWKKQHSKYNPVV